MNHLLQPNGLFAIADAFEKGWWTIYAKKTGLAIGRISLAADGFSGYDCIPAFVPGEPPRHPLQKCKLEDAIRYLKKERAVPKTRPSEGSPEPQQKTLF